MFYKKPMRYLKTNIRDVKLICLSSIQTNGPGADAPGPFHTETLNISNSLSPPVVDS